MTMMQKREVAELYNTEAEVRCWSSDTPTALSALEIDYIQRLFPWKDRLVGDIGAGAGRMPVILASAGAKVVALDLSANLMRALRRRADGANQAIYEVSVGDAENLPLAMASLDVVACLMTLELLPNPQRAVSEMRRVLKPNGVLILGANNRLSIGHLASVPSAIYRWAVGRRPIYRAYTARELRRWLSEAGFVIRQVRGFGLLPPGVSIPLSRDRALPLYPRVVGRWALTLEVKHGLGGGILGRFAKELIIVAQAP